MDLLQEGDYRIIMINTFEIQAYHIICEVGTLMHELAAHN